MSVAKPRDQSGSNLPEPKYPVDLEVASVNRGESGGHDLHRGLKSRQITMIAIGGAIGTGLIIGTFVLPTSKLHIKQATDKVISGKSLAQAGPAPLFIGYTLVGFLCFLVMAALGEMAAWLPMSSGFTGYATRFCDPALGFALGWNYWFNIKVLVILGLILLSLILACGGGPNHHATGFEYWKSPGAFKPYILEGSAGRFLAVWSTFTTAVFAYLGTELVGVTVGEAANPRKVIPRAIRLTFYRILLFYVVLIFFLGMLVPYNSKDLIDANKKSSSTASASPFVVAIKLSGIKVLPGLFNACVLIFVFSAANSDLYIASRTLYGLAHENKAPKIFGKTDKRGMPIYALGLSTVFCLLAFLGCNTSSYTVFGYFVNLVTMFGLLTWISILISHIYFVRARQAQNVPDTALAYVAPLGIYGSYGALVFSCLIAFFKGFALFCYKKTASKGETPKFDTSTFVTTYLAIPIYIIMIFGYKLIMKSEAVKPETADLYSGKAKIDAEEQEYLAAEAAQAGGPESRGQRIYRLTLGWAF
ncbi:Dicarboxylic amino acid permease [Lachnellula willkommii]|uniref:Dicarboxylic amino acid permease n=1 Tax=Lachnellula willkommii TaxID=215461 RepID=A0A559M4E2_9HELO|nr:Dicarboxylic amino acid permease [Lachnellula willkommii]